jgi:hypothetical protein
MKAILFVPTGEVRAPRAGEYCLTANGDRAMCPTTDWGNFNPSNRRPIMTKHEIEIDDDATELLYWGQNDDHVCISQTGLIPIVKPQKVRVKIRKWQWEIRNDNGVVWVTRGHHTENEVKQFGKNAIKLEKTEIAEEVL